MQCCVECFNDPVARKAIEKDGEPGDCSYCGSRAVATIQPNALSHLFDSLLDHYEVVEEGTHYLDSQADPTNYGESLAFLLNDEWFFFSEELIAVDGCTKLLGDIMVGVGVNDLWTSRDERWYVEPDANEWIQFAHRLRTERRFVLPRTHDEPGGFPGYDPLEHFRELVATRERVLAQDVALYRARVGGQADDQGRVIQAYPHEKMGAPQPGAARFGRANPPGISYLYGAFDETTAIAEMRVGRKAVLSLAQLALSRELQLVDVADVPHLASPLDRETLHADLVDWRLLHEFGEALSKPVRPEDSAVDYVPTQYLAELALDMGYDGLEYGSGFGTAHNLVLFDTSVAKVVEVKLVSLVESTIEWNDYLP